MKSQRFRFALFTSLLVTTSLVACGDDEDEEKTPIGPAGPPGIVITSVVPVGADAAALNADCIKLGQARALTVNIATENWILRPPGSCSALPQCGYVQVGVDTPSGTLVSKSAATASVLLNLAALEGKFDQVSSIHAELILDNGKPFEAADGTHALANQSVRLTTGNCPGSSGGAGSGGVGNEGGAAGAAGQNVQAGAAGQGGSSGGLGGESGGGAGNAGTAGALNAGSGGA